MTDPTIAAQRQSGSLAIGEECQAAEGDAETGDRASIIAAAERAGVALSSRTMVVSVSRLTLTLMNDDVTDRRWPISLAAAGIGSVENSNRTPLGLHRICQRIGCGEPAGMVFRGRQPTGEIWHPGGNDPENLILTRILRLEGLENDVNRGPGIDSFSRFIYIHGTNREDAVGRINVSHGCVLMNNADTIELFECVGEGDLVLIRDDRVDMVG